MSRRRETSKWDEPRRRSRERESRRKRSPSRERRRRSLSKPQSEKRRPREEPRRKRRSRSRSGSRHSDDKRTSRRRRSKDKRRRSSSSASRDRDRKERERTPVKEKAVSPEAGAGRWWEQPMFNWRGKKPERTRGAKSPPPKRSPSPQRSTPWWTEKRTKTAVTTTEIPQPKVQPADPETILADYLDTQTRQAPTEPLLDETLIDLSAGLVSDTILEGLRESVEHTPTETAPSPTRMRSPPAVSMDDLPTSNKLGAHLLAL